MSSNPIKSIPDNLTGRVKVEYKQDQKSTRCDEHH